MPTTIPLIRQWPFARIVSSLEDMTVAADRLLPRNHLAEWQYGNAEDMIPLFDFLRAFEIGARATGAEEFGLLMAEQFEVAEFGAYGAAITTGKTVFEAMGIASRLAPKEATTARYWLVPCKGGYLFCRKQLFVTPETDHGLRMLEQYSLELMSKIVRLGAGPAWRTPEVFLSVQETRFPRRLRQFRTAKIDYETPFSAIFVPDAVLALPIERPGAALNGDHEQHALSQSTADQDLSDAVLAVLRSQLHLGASEQATIGTMAELAGLSRRTLQRRLAQSGAPFHRLYDLARYQTAMELLEDPDLRIADIADSTGYEHPQHFIDAFKRWTGMTPGRYHRAKIHGTGRHLS